MTQATRPDRKGRESDDDPDQREVQREQDRARDDARGEDTEADEEGRNVHGDSPLVCGAVMGLSRTMQRKPMWAVDVSTVSPCLAAGR